jgi:hypothetical protein
MGAAALLWIIPLIIMSGGLFSYLALAKGWSEEHLDQSTEGTGTLIYMTRFATFTFYTLVLAGVPIAWAFLRRWRFLKDQLLNDRRAQILALWIIPGACYFAFIHLKQQGHIFTIVPALIIVAALALIVIEEDLAKVSPYAGNVIATLIIVGNGLVFLLGPAHLFGSPLSIFSTPTWTSIREHDNKVEVRLAAIRAQFDPAHTVVIAGSSYFRLPDFYLKDYQLPSLSHKLEEYPVNLPVQVNTIVFFDDTAPPQATADVSFDKLTLPDGTTLQFVTWNDGAEAKISQTSLSIEGLSKTADN